jgi:hypothetical protein
MPNIPSQCWYGRKARWAEKCRSSENHHMHLFIPDFLGYRVLTSRRYCRASFSVSSRTFEQCDERFESVSHSVYCHLRTCFSIPPIQ